VGQFVFQKNYTTSSPADLVTIVAELKTLFRERTILLLEGPVGAGKTELVRALSENLGIQESASPSFAIHHRYDGMDHVDLYRLQDEDDLESTGFWDLFGQQKGLVVIEWSDRLNQDLLPLNWHKIKIEIQKPADPHQRRLQISVFR
jgi:tRNA threonylcarbamoyladenosine biosynthesis protein TsaE